MPHQTQQYEPLTEVESWRLARLRDLGFTAYQAGRLLEHPDVAHDAWDLVNAGCSPALAYRILRGD